MDINCWYH